MPRPPVVALLALAAACGGSSSPAPTSYASAFPDAAQGLAPRLAVDAGGGHHLATLSPAGGRWTVRYGHCAAGCADPSRWAFVEVGDLGTLGGSVTLALDASGRPRLAWVYAVEGEAWYHYAACDTGCDGAAGWSDAPLWAAGDPLRVTQWLALDAAGNPRLAYADTRTAHQGAFLASCDSACAAPTSWLDGRWSEVQLSASTGLRDFAVAIDAGGRTRVAARWPAQGPASVDDLAWFQCDGGCDAPASWSAPSLVYALGADGIFALRLDPAGNPRLALYQGDLSAAGATGRQLFHAWCDAGCGAAQGWRAARLPVDAGEGANGVDLALAPGGATRIAYGSVASGTAVGLATCEQGCTATGATWGAHLPETAAALAKAEPRTIPDGYQGAGWLTLGRAPSIALDPAGAVRIACGAEHARWNGSPPVPEYDELRVRLASEQP